MRKLFLALTILAAPIGTVQAASNGQLDGPHSWSPQGYGANDSVGWLASPSAPTGTGNTIVANGGTQTITITGAGNQLSLGPYNDAVTVSSPGNVIDGGGGNDTVILAYGGGANVATNADLAAVSPLASVGNAFIAPAPRTGVLTIQGALAVGDKIDLRKALAGIGGWTHNPADIWKFVWGAFTPGGCVLSIGDTPVLTLPGGSPNANLDAFVTAN